MATALRKKVLILGASGMLGNAALRYFTQAGRYEAVGSVRTGAAKRLFPEALRERLVVGGNADNADNLIHVFGVVRPDIVINCIGLVKHLEDAEDPLAALPINAMLPHRIARLCGATGARLLHISTDCVFSGKRGMYREDDVSDATDVYGQSKYLGEVAYPHTVTLRTSMIGHELSASHGLIGWFLQQQGEAPGFTKAIFSGLPTIELARIMHDLIIPDASLAGVYHVSAAPIDKYSLLKEVARVYRKDIHIRPDDKLMIDRSLDSARFRSATGYSAPPWPELVQRMHDFG